MEALLAAERKLRVGCRGTDFCRAQTAAILERIRAKNPGSTFEIIEIGAPADVATLVEAIGAGQCDLHVCGAREIPLDLPEDVVLAACTERRDPFDVLIAQDSALLEDLEQGTVLGVDSARAKVQIAGFRDDLEIVRVEGTVDRLLDRLNAGEFAAFIVAAEEVEILGWEKAVAEVFPPDILLPAAGQGSFGLLTRHSDRTTAEIVRSVDHVVTRQVVRAERAFLRELGVRTTDPVAVHGSFEGDTLVLEALLGDEVSGAILRDDLDGQAAEEDDLGIRLAKLFVADGARDYLAGYR
jgi:hydroxymethylbilane synthase